MPQTVCRQSCLLALRRFKQRFFIECEAASQSIPADSLSACKVPCDSAACDAFQAARSYLTLASFKGMDRSATCHAVEQENQQLNDQLERTTCVSSDSQLGTQWRFKHYGNRALPLADLRLGHSFDVVLGERGGGKFAAQSLAVAHRGPSYSYGIWAWPRPGRLTASEFYSERDGPQQRVPHTASSVGLRRGHLRHGCGQLRLRQLGPAPCRPTASSSNTVFGPYRLPTIGVTADSKTFSMTRFRIQVRIIANWTASRAKFSARGPAPCRLQ